MAGDVVEGIRAAVALDAPVDLRAVLGPLVRGSGDPTIRVASAAAVRAAMTEAGPGAIELRVDGGAAGIGGGGADGHVLRARAWGPGAEILLAGVPALIGLDDDDAGFDPSLHPVVASLARRARVRLGRTGAVWEALLPAMLEQKITGTEAWRNYRRLVKVHGTSAPGPLGLLVAPTPDIVAGIPQYGLIALGIEPRRATLLRRVASEAGRFEAMAEAARRPGGGGRAAAALAAALQALPGIGPWTAAEVTLRALGDPDAVSVGDAHLSHVVGFALRGLDRATDEEMLELLAPWAGHRARVVRLLEQSGMRPPRYGPRVAPRDLARDLSPRCAVRGYRRRGA